MTKPALTGAGLRAALETARQTASPKLQSIAQFAHDESAAFARMSSREICARLHTSEPTLIRFCRQFGHSGLAEFRIELAMAMASQQPGLSFVPQASDRRLANVAAKAQIARTAAALLGDTRSLLIDNGSTAEAFAAELGAAEPLTIMTNGLLVAQNALSGGQHRVMLTGGDITAASASLGGRMVEKCLQDMRFDSFIMGADSIDPGHGLSTFSEPESHVTRAMLEVAERVIVLADHSKFRRPGLHRICGMRRVHMLVTDRPLAPQIAEEIGAHDTQIIVATPDETAP